MLATAAAGPGGLHCRKLLLPVGAANREPLIPSDSAIIALLSEPGHVAALFMPIVDVGFDDAAPTEFRCALQ